MTCLDRHRGEVEILVEGILNPALEEGGFTTSRSCRFTLGKGPVSVVQGAGWAPGRVWTGAENLTFTGIRSPDRPALSVVAILTELSRPQCVYVSVQHVRVCTLLYPKAKL
jgi:hypothetical protein